mgnify:CR=1 FL=1
MVRLDQQANLNSREFATSLPRMGFEIKGLSYDPSRKLTRVQKYSQVKSGEDGKKVNFNIAQLGLSFYFGDGDVATQPIRGSSLAITVDRVNDFYDEIYYRGKNYQSFSFTFCLFNNASMELLW